MKKLKNVYKNPKDGILQRGHPHRTHNKNKKKKVNLAKLHQRSDKRRDKYYNKDDGL